MKLAAAITLVVLLAFPACTKKSETGMHSGADGASSDSATGTGGRQMSDVKGLKVEVLKDGTGGEAIAGKRVSVHYTGWLEDGTKFDSSLDRGTPFQFLLGAGQVIQGWDKGVQGMKTGEKRKLTISPELGYGANGAGDVIPPNATLVFEVELLEVL